MIIYFLIPKIAKKRKEILKWYENGNKIFHASSALGSLFLPKKLRAEYRKQKCSVLRPTKGHTITNKVRNRFVIKIVALFAIYSMISTPKKNMGGKIITGCLREGL